jgi:hypothetical protein
VVAEDIRMSSPNPKFLRRSSVATLSPLLMTSPAFADDEPGDGFDVTSYRLTRSINIQDRTVADRKTIMLCVTDNGVQRLRCSGNALNIDSAVVDGVVVVPNTR